MIEKKVHIRKNFAAPADAVWTILRQFCADWHPLIEWIKPERTPDGRLQRCFKVKGEDGLYRELLTFFSDTRRELHYCHIEGIAGVHSYAASISVLPDGAGCTVAWQADIVAAEPRASEIAEGTHLVFEQGLTTLAMLTKLESVIIASEPALAITHGSARPGPLLLFLHGIGGNRGNWSGQLSCTSQYLQSAALDLRGYGDSALAPAQTRIDDYCDDILRVMAHLGKDRVIVCGMSLGSWIATSFAMRHPDILAGLVLSGGCTGMSEAPPKERQNFLAARQKPLDQGLSPADFAGEVVKVIAGPNASDKVLAELHASMAGITSKTYRDALWCFTHPQERFDFSRIKCPVLMMTGEHDILAPPVEIETVARQIHSAAQASDVSFEIVTDAGHLCNLENPQVYNAHLGKFLQRFA